MSGVEEYKKGYYQMTINAISKSDYKEIMESFYYFLLSKMEHSSAYTYVNHVISFLDETKKSPRDLKMVDYTKYMYTKKNDTSSYQIAVYSALKKFSKFLEANEINKNYMQYIERPKAVESQKTKDKREKSFLTKKDCENAISNVKNSNRGNFQKTRDELILLILLTTGIRRAALYKLDVEDVNIDERYINVAEKGGVQRRVYYPEIVDDVMEKWMFERSIRVKNGEHAFLISNRNGRMSKEAIGAVAKKNSGRYPHKWRATYGTQTYNATGDLFLVQQAMGHSNPKTTEIYIRGQKNTASQKAATLMGNFLGNIIDDE